MKPAFHTHVEHVNIIELTLCGFRCVPICHLSWDLKPHDIAVDLYGYTYSLCNGRSGHAEQHFFAFITVAILTPFAA